MALLPTTNLRQIYHVACRLGETFESGGRTYLHTSLAKLCTSGRINMWSRRKPVRFKADNTDIYPEWWRATDGKCGIDFPTYTSIGSLDNPGSFLYNLRAQTDKWTHAAPRGTSVEPYRLGDFRGYKHDAIPAVEALEQEYYDVSNNRIQIDFDLAVPSGDPDNLSLSDLSVNGVSLSDYYIGAMLYRSGGTYMIGTSDTPMGTGSASMVIDGITDSRAGLWTGYVFMSREAFGTGDPVPESVFLCFPVAPLRVNIRPQGTVVQIYCIGNWTDSARNRVEYTITIDNGNGLAVRIDDIQAIFVRVRGNGDPESDGETVATYTHPSSVTVPGNDRVTIGPFTQAITYTEGYTYWIAGRSSYAGIRTSFTPIEDIQATYMRSR